MYLLMDFCCTLLAHMPLYIAPSFLKLFLLLYSGSGEVEGRERNRNGNSTKPRPPAVGPCPRPVEGPVLKAQHLECKTQFHSASVAPVRGSRAIPAGASLSQEQPSRMLQGSEQLPWPGLACPALFPAEIPAPGSGAEVLLREAWHWQRRTERPVLFSG